ncbi:MAG: amidohydrolase family protein [Gammaproteobacteria bacterium]
MFDHPLISADDHFDLDAFPPSLFTDRVASKLRDSVPTVVQHADGPMWSIGGRLVGPSGRRPGGQITHAPLGLRPGNPAERLEEMDRDRMYTQVIYGPPNGLTFVDDPALRVECVRAYNDHAVQFNAYDPNRLVILALLPGHAPEAAIAELERAAKIGLRGVLLPLYESPTLPFGPAWERFWAAAHAAALPVHFHLSGGASRLAPKLKSWEMPAYTSIVAMQMDEPLSALIFSGVLERYPGLKVVFGESGLGWVPYLIARMDQQFGKYNSRSEDIRLSARPSEIFRRQVLMTFEEDDLGISLLDRIGADSVMWASDFPHGDTTWPNSHKVVEHSHLSRIDAGDRYKILCGNAAKLYRIDVEAGRRWATRQ